MFRNNSSKSFVRYILIIILMKSLLGADTLGNISDIGKAAKTYVTVQNKDNEVEVANTIGMSLVGVGGSVLDKVGRDFVNKGNDLLSNTKEMNALAKRAEVLLAKYPKTFANNNKINKVTGLVAKFKNNANNSLKLASKVGKKAQLFKSAGKALGGAATVYAFTQTSKEFKKKLDSGNITSLDKAIYIKDASVAVMSVIPGVGSAIGLVDMGTDVAAYAIDKTLDKGRDKSLAQVDYFLTLKANAKIRALNIIKHETLKSGNVLSEDKIREIYKDAYSVALFQMKNEKRTIGIHNSIADGDVAVNTYKETIEYIENLIKDPGSFISSGIKLSQKALDLSELQKTLLALEELNNKNISISKEIQLIENSSKEITAKLDSFNDTKIDNSKVGIIVPTKKNKIPLIINNSNSNLIKIRNSKIINFSKTEAKTIVKSSNTGILIKGKNIEVSNSLIKTNTIIESRSKIINSNLGNKIIGNKVNIKNSEINSNVVIARKVIIINSNLGNDIKGKASNVNISSKVKVSRGTSVKNSDLGVSVGE